MILKEDRALKLIMKFYKKTARINKRMINLKKMQKLYPKI